MTSPAVLMQYFTSEFGVLAFVIRRDFQSPEVVEIALDPAPVAAYCEAGFSGASLQNLDLFDWQKWQSVLAPLMAPVAKWTLPGDTIWIVPDAFLHGLPLHALHVDGVPLIERNPVCYTPSASTMVYCSRKGGSGHRARGASFGDSLSERPLPQGRRESKMLADAFGIAPILGEAVTRSTVLRLLGASGLDVIHFACHMVFDATEPLRSGILLAREQDDAREDEPCLTAEEILHLRLSADLVLLSGCVSGVSVRKLGDELLGLSRAWLYAGASSVLASLWPADDLASAVLMTRFVSELELGAATHSPSVAKADALRRAQSYLRNLSVGELGVWNEVSRRGGIDLPSHKPRIEPDAERPFANPYYWAPFVLIGDYR